METTSGDPLDAIWRQTPGLCLQQLADELLVYDLNADRAHSLNAAAARVFAACDGIRPVREVNDALGSDQADLTLRALYELSRAGLLISDAPAPKGPSRRALLRGLGAATALLPVVSSIVAPSAAQAASCAGFLQPANGRPCCGGLTVNLFGICIGIGLAAEAQGDMRERGAIFEQRRPRRW